VLDMAITSIANVTFCRLLVRYRRWQHCHAEYCQSNWLLPSLCRAYASVLRVI